MADTEILSLLSEIDKAREPEPLSIPEQIAGYSRSYLAGPTFNFADEAEAGIAALMQSLFSGGSLGENYENELDYVRGEQKRFKEQTPYIDNAVEIASSLALNPVGAAGKALQAGKYGLQTLGKIGASAPAQAALASIGMTEGDENILADAGKGALFGSAGSALASTVGKALEKTGVNADRFKLSAYGIGASDINKQLKKLDKSDVASLGAIDDIPIVSTLNKYEKAGIINAGNDMLTNFKNVISRQESLGKSLTNVLDSADSVVPPSATFQTKITDAYIDSLTGTAREKALQAATEEYVALTSQLGAGTLKDLQKAKVGLNYKFDQNPYADDVIKALRSDLRQEIENRTNAAASQGLVPTTVNGVVRKLNSEWGGLEELSDAFLKGIGKRYGGNAVEDIIAMGRTSGGVGSLNIASATSGNPIYAASGALLSAARAPEALSNLGDVAREFRAPLTAAGKALPEAVTGRTTAQAIGPLSEKKEKPKNLDTNSIRSLLDEIESARQGGGGGDPLFNSLFTAPQKKEVKSMESPNTALAKKLVSSLITQESSGDPTAVSDKGAQGLMQIMPATWAEWAPKVGVDVEKPFDPDANKKVGIAYLTYLLDKYEGDPELALTAYHSGMRRVDSLLAEKKGTKLSDIIDALGPVGRRYASDILGRVLET